MSPDDTRSIPVALAEANRRLASAEVPSPDHDAEALLAEVLSVPRGQLRLTGQLSGDQAVAYDQLVERRATREPLQHITGRAAFRYVEVEVGPGVFVPRPETESLVGWAVDVLLDLVRGGSTPIVVDLCTGSGAAALALATEVPGLSVHAVELSQAAHGYAERNLAASGVHLHLADVAIALPELDGTVDVVVANPPYVPLDAYESVSAEARDFDPPSALWAGPNGMEMVRVVERTAARLLRPGGRVGCEHAEAQEQSAPAVFAASGAWTDVRDLPDLGGRPRFVTALRARAGTMRR